MVGIDEIYPLAKRLVQVAGVVDEREARMLSECGVDFLGIPLRIASGEEDVSEGEAKRIIQTLNPPVYGVLITYLLRADEIWSLAIKLNASVVQLHGDVPLEEIKILRSLGPDLIIMKTLVVKRDNLVDLTGQIDETSPFVDAFLADTFDEETGERGATGKTHDWSISRQLVQYAARPVILAGGLSPENVHQAVLEVRPAGVDAHTGVEDAMGRKSRVRVEKFVAEARKAFRSI